MNFKKIASGVLASVMAFTSALSVQNNLSAAPEISLFADGDVYFTTTMDIENYSSKKILISNNGSSDFGTYAATQVYFTQPDTGEVMQAYCVEPALAGYGYNGASDTYTVDISAYDDSVTLNGKSATTIVDGGITLREALTGVVSYGYPSYSAEELFSAATNSMVTAATYGVTQDEFEYAAYVATKFAGWCFLKYDVSNFRDYAGTSLSAATLKVLNYIYNKAKTYDSSSVSVGTISMTATDPVLNSATGKHSITYTIDTSSTSLLTGKDIYIRMPNASAFPSDTNFYQADGSTALTFTTLANGTEQYNLPAGQYSFIVEVADPDTNALKDGLSVYATTVVKNLLIATPADNSNKQTYAIAGNAAVDATATYDTEGDTETGWKIYKTDASTNQPLAGVTFEVVSEDGSTETVTSDQDGYANPTMQVAGTYTVTETAVPDGYELQSASKTITVTKGSDSTTNILTFSNEKKTTDGGDGDWKILKLDALTGQPVAGITFDVYNSAGQLVDTGTSGSDGYYVPAVQDAGTYTVIERASQESDYQLTQPTTQVVTVTEDTSSTVVVTFRDYTKTTISLHKVDPDGNDIAGVEYMLEQIDAGGTIKKVAETDSSGNIVWTDIPDGTYKVYEVSTVDGYILDSTPQYVTISNGQAASLKFVNSKTPSLTITKIDSDGNVITSGQATFRVAQQDGTFTTDVTTSGGTVTITDLDPGTYTITEISAPSGYVVDSCYGTVYVGADTSVTYYATNAATPVLTIQKIDASSGNAVPGTIFEVKQADGTVIGTVTTGSDGKVTIGQAGSDFGYLDPGTYTITEIFVPDPYILTGESITIQLNAGDTKSITFQNYVMPTVTIYKYDEDTLELLPNAEFAVYNQYDLSRPVYEGVTDANGKIELGYLEPGTYVIKEINPPPGYTYSTVTDSVRTIVLQEGDEDIVLKFDNKKLPTLIIKKVDSRTGDPISGVTYSVVGTDDTSYQPATATTDVNGLIEIVGLPEGTYTVTEISSPYEYILNSTPQTVKLEAGDVKTLLFENIKYPTLVIYKYDYSTNKGIAGATFQITRTNDDGSTTVIGTYQTNSDGYIILEHMEPGWYTYTETIPAQGYSLPSNPTNTLYLAAGTNAYGTSTDVGDSSSSNDSTGEAVAYAITYGGDYEVVGGVVNYPLNSIVIKKSDANTGEMLAGATFEVIRATGETSGTNGTVICTVTTDVSGVVVITGLEAGSYVVKEITAPNGYIISETNLQSVTLKADGTSIVEVIFNNYPYGSISINKVDGSTGQPLQGATFSVTDAGGNVIGNYSYTTDANGNILIDGIAPATSVVVTETSAPDGYAIDTTPQTVLMDNSGGTKSLTFTNYPYGSLLITKVDALTGTPLANARFRVTDSSGAVAGNTNGEYITDENGEILISTLAPGSYVVTELEAPEGYVIDTTPQTIEITSTGKVYKVSFKNQPIGTLAIKKYDSDSKEPLADATFLVKTSSGDVVGTNNGYYTTDETGTIQISGLPKDTYVITETKAPDGYILENQTQTIAIDYGKTYTVEFYNKIMSSLQIIKIDSETKEPLKDAKFTVYWANGEVIGNYTTDGDGLIIITGLEPGWIKIVEIKAPDGYLIDDTAQDVEITSNQFVKVTFENKKLTSLIIKKIDADSGEPLSGAKFYVEKQNGEHVGEYTTDSDGVINIPTLDPDWYIVRETSAPDGYLLDETAKTVEVKTNVPTVVTFENKKLTSLIIKKVDSSTGAALAGAVFTVEKQNGEKVYTSENGTEFTTDANGLITIPTLEPDYYIVREVKAPSGYILDGESKTVEVKTNSPTTVTFTNTAQAGLKIIKTNSETGATIEGVEFTIAKMNGEKVSDEYGSYTFTTDSTGQVYIPGLDEGYYVVTETKAADGYITDEEPKTVLVEAGKVTVLEVKNDPASGLLIVKTDAQTGEPLEGVVFDISRSDGSWVQGDILDENQPNTLNNSANKSTSSNGFVAGSYTTDYRGRIQINHMEPGVYYITERKALDGYELDTEVYSVTVTAGKQAVLKLENTPLAGLRLKKIDSITQEPLFNVEFMVFDANNKVVGTYYTNNDGMIDFTGILEEGRYTIRETRAAEGYYSDDVPRTVEFVAGQITEIVWENTPEMGQIQITKLSQDDNEVNGLPAGTPLEGAIFEVYAYKSGNLVDRFVTGSNGVGVSNPLPLGRYVVKEVQAPSYYQLNSEEMDITIEFATQIIKLEFRNKSANTGVTIKKTGNTEAMPGDTIRYDIQKVSNDSTIQLTDFFWRDVLPTDAVRLTQIVTGTYNQSLRYKIMVTTNKGESFLIADNLSTTQNNVVDCSNASLGLGLDEYVTSFTLIFGTVKAGFTCVEKPQVFVSVLSTLQNGYQFANKVDVGGKTGEEWVIGNSTWLTTIYRTTSNKLPRTGY